MAGKLTLEPDMDHLRFSGAAPADQLNVLQRIIESDSMLPDILRRMEELGLPDCWLGSGAIYNTVWNVLTGRPAHQGIKDIDVVYFDASDLSYEAEDAIIRRAAAHFADCPIPVELRNQARVHLWFPEKFGIAYPRLERSTDMLLYFSTKTHAVAAQLDGGVLRICAPFGLDDLFSFRLTPNPTLPNRATHEAKAQRAMAQWPELTMVPWPA